MLMGRVHEHMLMGRAHEHWLMGLALIDAALPPHAITCGEAVIKINMDFRLLTVIANR